MTVPERFPGSRAVAQALAHVPSRAYAFVRSHFDPTSREDVRELDKLVSDEMKDRKLQQMTKDSWAYLDKNNTIVDGKLTHRPDAAHHGT